MMLIGALLLPVVSLTPQVVETVRRMNYQHSDHRVRLKRVKGTKAVFFQSKISCDVDGSPNAYHPLDDNLSLDVIGSAGGRRRQNLPAGPLEVLPSPEVVVYQNGKPYVQPDGPFKGFYVSETSYQNRAMAATDPTRYLDARHFHYIVLPGGMVPEARIGDLAAVYDPAYDKVTYAVFGDIGPSTESGEASLGTLQGLGLAAVDGKSSPGQCRNDLVFLVFPGTVDLLEAREPWPHAQATVDALASEEFAKWGGIDRLRTLVREDPDGGSIADTPANTEVFDGLAVLRQDRLLDRLGFDLPPRWGQQSNGGRLPCPPEIADVCHGALRTIQRRVELLELGQSAWDGTVGERLSAHLGTIRRILRRYPVDSEDLGLPVVKVEAAAAALNERLAVLSRRKAA